MSPQRCVRVHFNTDFKWSPCIPQLLQIMPKIPPTVSTIRVSEKKKNIPVNLVEEKRENCIPFYENFTIY